MRERYIPPFIMLLAGAIVSIYNIVNKTEVLTALKRLFIVLIIFYIIGLIVKALYMNAVVKAAKKSKDGQAEPDAENSGEGGNESRESGTIEQKQDGKQKQDNRQKQDDRQKQDGIQAKKA